MWSIWVINTSDYFGLCFAHRRVKTWVVILCLEGTVRVRRVNCNSTKTFQDCRFYLASSTLGNSLAAFLEPTSCCVDRVRGKHNHRSNVVPTLQSFSHAHTARRQTEGFKYWFASLVHVIEKANDVFQLLDAFL